MNPLGRDMEWRYLNEEMDKLQKQRYPELGVIDDNCYKKMTTTFQYEFVIRIDKAKSTGIIGRSG